MTSPHDAAIQNLVNAAGSSISDLLEYLEAVNDELTSRIKRLIGLPVPTFSFLVPDGQTPEPTQLSETQFIALFLGKIAGGLAAGGHGDADLTILTKATRRMITTVRSLGGTEVLVRLMLNLDDDGDYEAGVIAQLLFETVMRTVADWSRAFETPVDPQVWTSTTPAPPGAGLFTSAATQLAVVGVRPGARIPGVLPSSGDIGNRVHRYVQEAYIADFPTDLVFIERGERLSPGPPPFTTNIANLGPLEWPQSAKVALYKIALVNPVTGAYWKPDIADLEDTLPGIALAPWGWFEIKNWKDTIEGVFQLSLYCAFYSSEAIGSHHPEWSAVPGAWIPPPVMMKPVPSDANKIALITRPLPGLIVYYVFDLSKLKPGDWVYQLVLAALIAHLIRQLLRRLAKVEAVTYATLGWAATIVLAVVAVASVVEALGAAMAAETVIELVALIRALTAWASASFAS